MKGAHFSACVRPAAPWRCLAAPIYVPLRSDHLSASSVPLLPSACANTLPPHLRRRRCRPSAIAAW